VFADPQSVTYNAVAKSLVKIGGDLNTGIFQLNDSGVVYNLTLSHQFKNRNRVVARLRRDAFASDPLIPAQNKLASMTASFTIDFPPTGYTVADAQSLGNALVAFLTTGNLLKLANGEV